MTDQSLARPSISLSRIGALAVVRARRVVRTRLALAALVLALLPWALVDGHSLLSRLSSLTEFSLAGLTLLGAGAVGDDLASGEYAIAMTHDVSPVEMLAGQAAASLALGATLVGLQLPIALAGVATPSIVPLMLCIVWLAALLAGWLGLMLLLATFLDGKANAVAMLGLLFLPIVDATLLERLPHAPAVVIRNTLQLLPQLSHATTMFRVLLSRSPGTMIAPFVLILSPLFYFAWASLRLYRLEPAGRLTQ